MDLMAGRAQWFLLIFLGFSSAWMDERPVLESRDGHLYISSAKDRNITLRIIGSGYVNVNEINLLHVASAAENATHLIERWRRGHIAQIEDRLQELTSSIEAIATAQKRGIAVDGSAETSSTPQPDRRKPGRGVTRNGMRGINDRMRRLEDRVRTIETKLRENECQSNPCQNGGSCQDLYEGYQCHCTSNWEGPNCMTDVNECVRLLGTDLGCQNGATCVNLPGSYRCDCAPGWFGLHCREKTSVCNVQTSEELCGHGVCVSKPGAPLGYTCICDQGWQSDGITPSCTRDVDECAGKHPPCSVNPMVACRNAPGTFFCDSCPRGYTGNGYYCTDIDECLMDNGGCSVNPRVQCMNTMGSRVCGPCPPGYRGDGVTCTYVGGCAINNGGCHPLAICVENPALSSAYVQCRCPAGYVGDGMGPNGCQPGTGPTMNSACATNPCVHGTCAPGPGNTFTCTCNPGFTGPTCVIRSDPCVPNPCKNSGTCLVSNGEVTCDCPSAYTGARCETPRQTCGGVSRNPVGHLEFPLGGQTYQHGLSCAWVLITNHSLVLNVTFTAFNLEHSTDCKFDFLQIHDGRNAGSHMIGRFCGDTLPNGSGNIISSHNTLYFWFHSDSSISHDGFKFHWNTIEPVCGGTLTDDYGTITSPGFPGRYPPNRDCFWTILVRNSRRIQFHFGQLMLEEHPTCDSDYVEITRADEERLGIYCNHTRPPPLITPGSEATIHFHSDGAGQDAGFQIHYATTEGTPGCSGVYTTHTGVISSPSHGSENSYQSSMECEWKIQLPPGERIKVTWSKFELESSVSCRFDYVEVFDGDNVDAPLIGRYCGTDLPPTIKSSGNSLVIIFETDYSIERGGFSLSYEVLCGGEFRDPTGILHSPLYPNNYHNLRTCRYEIIQPPERRIALSILDMDIEGISPSNCFFDSLEIYDGDSDSSPELATLCGDEEHIPSTPYYSTNNYMLLVFRTDGSITSRGFQANYTTIENRCGGLIKEHHGTIRSPQDNLLYGSNEHCVWTLQAPPGYVIQLVWLSFNLEHHFKCRFDYVTIYEASPTSDRETHGTFCGTNLPPIVTSQSNTLTIEFRTDNSVTSEGFVLSYIFIDASRVCGGHYTRANGAIKSPNYPEPYPNSKECVWIIEAPNKHKVILNVHEFKLEGNSRCNFDYVEIRNGGYEMAPLIGKFCGTDIPSEIISHTNQLYIKFVSDESRSATGFSFEWDSATEGCGGTLTGATGDIMSPNYPQPYADNVDCQWKIVVAAGSLVQLVIIDLELEQNQKCRFDYVEISDGPGSRWNSQRYCSNSHPHIIQSKANMMTIRFRSDFSTSARGFHLKYETLCHNKLHGIYGVIESPNFPMKYPQNANCSWIIDAPLGNKINLTFSHFDLELANYMRDCRYDYVQVKEGELDTPNRVLGTYCNTDALPQKIHSTQHQVFVSFMTDSFNEFNGFRLEWAVDGCVGHLTKPSDSFTSPGYPNGYPINIDCEWVIEVDYTHSIELTFHEIQTEKHNECHFDKVEVFGGEDEQAPKLVEICYSEKPVTYTSPGNKMFVKLHSDMSYAGRGFSASYRSVAISCGGKFTADAGIIHSPNYPQNYPGKQNCEWLLEVDRNYIVNITFLDFDLENSRNCSDDYVRIYDGPTRDSPVLANHCQNELPPSYISSGNQMLVVMRTDSMVSAKGFKAAYSRACGARIVVKDSGYLIPAASPMGSLVPQHTNCTWILLAEDPADHVTLTFTHMDIDPSGVSTILGCSWAYLEIFEGEGIHGPSRGKWCNNVAPAPITSTGNAITVNLYAYYQAFGHFSIMYSSLNTACGGNYTSEHGTIASPGYPNSYPLNAECIWILNTSPGNRVTLSFSEFDIQQSENCDLDYLEIRENNGIGKLISVSCGTEIDTVTSSATLWIKFRSDGDGTGKGFRGEYSFLGGNELEGPMGRITSPLYPMLYRQSGTISWRILVEYGWNIRIEFTSLQIEKSGSTCMGSLKVYDGYDSDAPLLTEACGLMAPEPIVTSSNIIYIVLTADLVRIGNSFDLTWLQVAGNSGSGEEEIKISNCTTEVGLLGERNSTYTFNSPGWPYGYDSHLECTWIFTSPPGTHLVLRITSMNLEETTDCMADALLVYSGFALTSTKDATLMQRLCLSNATADVVETGNVMTVKFETDSYVNKTGFSAFVYRECGGKLTGPNGVIETYNITTVRGVRMWRLNCEWTVEVRPGRTIEVNITDMEITQGPSQTCTDNYLLLKNGIEVASPLLGTGKYCGNVLPASLETTGNRLFVKAVGTRPNVQFKLVYREKSMNCGGEFVLSSKQNEWEINTPNYPNIPHPYSECTWKVMAPAGERISIHFIERFDLSNTANCEREYVEIRDGSTDNSKLMGRFCKDTAPSSMTTSGNMMYIHFYTDVPEPKNGFKAVITSGEFCGGFVRGTSGVINSPNYPLSYPKNQNCSWWIIGPTDHTLKIQFRDFHLPGYYNCQQTDHVNIIEESPDNFTTHNVGTYCGNRKPDIIETWTNEVFVQFHSGTRTYMSFKGFSLNFTASQAVCGGELTAMSGIIKPDGYPVPRTHSRYCDWRITLPRGYQVVVDILDLDIVGTSSGSAASRPSYSLSFYNDFRYKSRIMVLGQGGTAQQIRSSGNLMMIRYRSSPGHRGFKLHYQGEAPAPCGGVITEANGTLSAPRERPFNESSFFCQWTIKPPERMVDAINDTGLTLAVKVTGLVGGLSSHVNTRLCFYPQYISLSDVGMICGNLESPRYLRSPKTVNELTILNGTYGRPMHFHLEYEWQPCGGVLQGSSHTISAPRNIPFPINCAWFANYPDTGEMIKVAFSKLNIGSCDESYIIIRNGVAASPEIGKFCGNMKPPNIASISNQLWIEYFAVGGPNDFEFILQPVSTACGGALRGYSREISSPDFPRQYPNNAECTWEITAENGYHVGLTFVDRFSLETSASCDKDYVQVFDWVKAANNSDGTWKDIGRVCGRNTPRPFNSTSNHMKVTFHSNEAVRGDGFRALWSENCGGVFEVTEDINIIQSPGYPSYYRPNLFCNYTLLAPDKDITVEFTNFQLERSRGDCKFDNVTIITFDPNGYGPENEETIWCSNIKPPIMRSLGRMEIIFRTDQYIQRTGFQFRYSINGCGGRLTAPGEIRPLVRDGEYFGRMNCTWIIEAPTDKRVVLRFEKFVIEYGYGCSYDKVAAYDDNWVNPEKILGSVCGNLTEYLPVFKSNSNSMVVTFTTDETRHAEGFAAKVLFVKSVAAGCGGTINLTATGRPYTFRTQKASTYESLEDCHWTVVAPPETNIRFTFNTMDLKNATNNATSVPKNECTGDYLEIHEGLGLYTPLLGRYCGNLIPMPVVSMTNALWIRFFSDGTIEGNGVTATLEALNTQCGPSVREIETTKQNLTSPRYPNPYEVGSLCRWLLRAPDTYSDIVRISFIDFDLPNSDRCEDDYLEISDKGNQHYVNEGFGENFIFSGKTDWPVRFEMASRQPMSSYKYCGSALPHEYYSYSNEVEVTFKANRGGHRGFKLEYGLPACNRNYTAEQGRIIHQGFTDCWITITAPVNRTISLYFNTFSLYDRQQCTENALQIRDGDINGNLLATLCGTETPSPIFSVSNKLTLHSWANQNTGYEKYDITYTTTSEGRGCGGRIYNYGGRFTSPLYPNMYRNNTVCTWDISVPRGFKVNLRFSVFDIGSKWNCANNNVKIYDVTPNNERLLRTTYCGDDDPAIFEAAGDRLIVEYTSTVNNMGTGWVASFMANPTAQPLPVVNF